MLIQIYFCTYTTITTTYPRKGSVDMLFTYFSFLIHKQKSITPFSVLCWLCLPSESRKSRLDGTNERETKKMRITLLDTD